jgi:uncharacterized protein involved in tellurium resistance
MNAMNNESIFDEIFGSVMVEKNIDAWYDLFDSSDYDEVIIRIGERFGFKSDDADALLNEMYDDLEGFANWHNMMCDDL